MTPKPKRNRRSRHGRLNKLIGAIMYVTYEEFLNLTVAAVPTHPIENGTDEIQDAITEAQYNMVAPIADAIIDNWTLDRVGRAVRNGEELPPVVVTLYISIIESLPALMDNSKVSDGGLVSSFSNGIDSYSFDVTSGMAEQLHRSLGWMLNLLPVEWCSSVVSFEGGNAYAR